MISKSVMPSTLFIHSSLLLLGATTLLSGCKTSKVPPGAPLDRVEAWHENPEYTVGNDDTLMEWMNQKAPATTVYTPEDRWPNGLAGSMTPFLIDWENSRWEPFDPTATAESRFMLVHNVYVSGNPILGKTRLATIRIPANGIKTVEFVIVRYHLKGLAKTSGHVQLRFVFHEDRRPQLLNKDGSIDQNQPYLDDLIISWEAWRSTMNSWDFKAGLNPNTYRLTPRMFSGSQRFLQDSLRGAVWDCYPLDLTAHESAADRVLLSGLLMGDNLGRNLIGGMLKEDLITDPTNVAQKKWKAEDERRAQKMFAWEGIPEHLAKVHLADADSGYHALERSCINLTYLQIEVAMENLYKDNDLGSRSEIHLAPESIPKWFDDVEAGNRWGTFFRAPHALFWLLGNKEVLPYKSYLPLKKAGLLQLDKKGNVILYRYGHKESSPYGPLSEKIM